MTKNPFLFAWICRRNAGKVYIRNYEQWLSVGKGGAENWQMRERSRGTAFHGVHFYVFWFLKHVNALAIQK